MVKQRSSKVKQKLILLIVLIGIMGFIYYMSAQPVVRSGEMSFRIDRLVCRLFVDGFENMTAEQQQVAVYDMDFLVLRLDWGIALHDPANNEKKGFYNISRFKDGMALHFAIGYPF